jgi:hypothetical protein
MLTLAEKAVRMRHAIDAMELALHGAPSLVELPEKWGDPRHRDTLGVTPKMTAGEVYRICDALAELTRIMNDAGYEISNLTE